MNWLEDLRYMESNVEKNEEKNIESENVGLAKTNELNTRNDILKEIDTVNNSINVIMDLKDLGLDITAAVSGASDKLKRLIELGQKNSLLNEEELSTLNNKLQSLLNLIDKNPTEQTISDKDSSDYDER